MGSTRPLACTSTKRRNSGSWNRSASVGKGSFVRGAATFLALSVAAVGAWLTPSVAHACSCFNEETLRWPLGGELAQNEAILLENQGCGTSLGVGPVQEHAAFVDGQQVELVPVAGRPGYTLDPVPEVGTTVTLARCGFEQECDLDTVSDDARWELTIVDAVDGGPSAPSLGELDYDLTEFDDCGFGTIKARDWTIAVTPDDDEPRLVEILVGPAGDESRRFVFTTSTASLGVTIRRTEEDAGKNVCATVRSYDMAGNQSTEASSCYELGQRETLDGGGCSCSADPNPGRNFVLTLLALTVLLRTRRS